MRDVNLEKIGVYVAALSIFLTFLTFVHHLQTDLSDTKERVRAVEVRQEKL